MKEEKSTLTKFIELAMYSQTKYTQSIFKRLNKGRVTPVSIIAILHLRDNYNSFMNNCNDLLEAEKLYRQKQFN